MSEYAVTFLEIFIKVRSGKSRKDNRLCMAQYILIGSQEICSIVIREVFLEFISTFSVTKFPCLCRDMLLKINKNVFNRVNL